MQVYIRYEDEFSNIYNGTASLTVEEEDAHPLAQDRARILGEKARKILTDFGLGSEERATPKEPFTSSTVGGMGGTVEIAPVWTVGADRSSTGGLPAPIEDLILTHAREVSRIEILWVEGWERAKVQGAFDKARAIIRAGTDAEHYLAMLAHNPADRTEEQSQRQRELVQELERAIELVPTPQPGPYP